jgi:hypothetical protein
MPIHSRPIAISAAVMAFFALSSIGLFSGLAPLTCCKRALIGSVLAYLATVIAVSILNAVLTKAIIDSHTNKRLSAEAPGAKAEKGEQRVG